MDHLASNSLFDSHQSANCKHHYTGTALLYIHDHLVSAIGSCFCLLDFAAAFDTIASYSLVSQNTSWSPASDPGLVSTALFSAGSSHICLLVASMSNSFQFHPRDAMLARVVAMAQCLSVTSRSSVEMEGWIEVVLACRLLSTYSTLYCKEIQVWTIIRLTFPLELCPTLRT